jgi:hypothetical protein
LLSKCANPACTARFRYLRQGKIFNIEVTLALDKRQSGPGKVEHFWLCEECAQTLRVVSENGIVSTQPLPLAPKAGRQRGGSQPDPGLALEAGAGS